MPISRIATVGAQSGSAANVANYTVEVWHEPSNRRQTLTGPIEQLIRLHAESLLEEWEAEWQRPQEKQNATGEWNGETGTNQKAELLAAAPVASADLQQDLRTLFSSVFSTERPTGWEQFRSTVPYPIPRPEAPAIPAPTVLGIQTRPLPPEPLATSSAYVSQRDSLDILVPFRRAKKEKECQALFLQDHNHWQTECARIQEMNAADQRRYEMLIAENRKQYEASLMRWDDERRAFEADQERNNQLVEQREQEYRNGDPAAVGAYCDRVLNSANYPAEIAASWRSEYIACTRTLNVECILPSPTKLPPQSGVFGGKSADELYENVIYQICLRSLYELFTADAIRAIDRVVFTGEIAREGNCPVAIGDEESEGGEIPWIMLDATRGEFLSLPLREEEPKTLIRQLQGIGDFDFGFVAGGDKFLSACS